ncbi:MAG TPA: F0F1 ATP synthase subunit B [Blastocatellia bacterium]|nr:F0F1 ATP synthase subunit B [Blastocatellia bacterium]
MNVLALFAEIEGGGQIERIAGTFGVDWPHLIAQMISFSIVCLLLYRYAYKRVLRVLEERRRLIARGLADSEKIKAELEQTEVRRQETMEQAYAQASRFIEEARGAAARLKEQETRKALNAVEQILVNARAAAAQDHDRMLAELKQEVGRLVVETAASITGKILTPEDQRRLAEEAARQLNQ